MAHIAQRKMSDSELVEIIPKKHREIFVSSVLPALNSDSRFYQNRALIITFYMLGTQKHLIAEFILYSHWTVRCFIRRFENGQHQRLLAKPKRQHKTDRQDLKDKLFKILHSPPSEYGINRTTWTIDLLHDVLQDQDSLMGKNAISRMIRDEGYVFRKTREVLTSTDPKYKENRENNSHTETTEAVGQIFLY